MAPFAFVILLLLPFSLKKKSSAFKAGSKEDKHFITDRLIHSYVDIQDQSHIQKQFTASQHLIYYFKTSFKKLVVWNTSFQTHH